MLIRVNRAGLLLNGVKILNNFTDWINFYIRKTGDSRIKKIIGNPKNKILYDKEHGFCVVIYHKNFLEIRQACGDGKYWEEVVEKIAADKGISKITCLWIRDINSVIKSFGWVYIGEDSDNKIYKNIRGHRIFIRPTGNMDIHKTPVYLTVKYMNKGAVNGDIKGEEI